MIKITIKQLLDAGTSGALSRYFALDKPITVSWKNRKQVAACEEEINKHYNDRRLDLCKKYGHLDEKTKEYVFVGEGVAADAKENFKGDMAKLLAEEIDNFPGEPVSVSVISGSIREADLRLLEPFLTD